MFDCIQFNRTFFHSEILEKERIVWEKMKEF